MTTSMRGKLITIGKRSRFFPALSRNPLGALDSAIEERDDDKNQAALDAVVRYIGDCSDAQAEELQAALDRRAGARDRRARDEGQPTREDVFRHARDDHRDDFRPIAAGGPDNPTAKDSRRMAHDRAVKARSCPDVSELFPT